MKVKRVDLRLTETDLFNHALQVNESVKQQPINKLMKRLRGMKIEQIIKLYKFWLTKENLDNKVPRALLKQYRSLTKRAKEAEFD
jgi:hypothetical protein